MMPEILPPLSRRRKGGRPKGDPAAVRAMTIGVRVSPSEYAVLKDKAAQMGVTPAQWLRQAALARRLPSPPVPAINRSVYAELARLSANFNQLAWHANRGESVHVDADLLRRLGLEVCQLRLALIGAGGQP
ncbi:MAG: mobilization protein [Thiomonas sp.]|nr:mobilization protein [Thiomonas sp.]